MNILDILRQAQGGRAVDDLARQFGVSPAAADAVLASVVPALAERLERNTLSRGGVAELVAALGQAAGRGYLDTPAALGGDAIKDEGLRFLDQILWTKDNSRSVAYRAAQTSGVSDAVIKQMLPVIAAMLMGGLAKATSGGLTDILSKIPGLPGGNLPTPGRTASPRPSAPWAGGGPVGGPQDSPLSMPGDSLPGPGMPRPGSGGFGEQSPLPLPGGRPAGGGWSGGGGSTPGPFDDLSDIIRRGGQGLPGGETSGGLAGLIRSILGAVLGFQSRGVVGWVLRYVVMRYGWGILRTIFSRVVLGRRA